MSGNTGTDIWIAGAFAAFSVDLLVYPLDTLKTRIQSPDYRRNYVDQSTNTLRKAAMFRGLYQGLGSVILATLPSSGAFFTTYEYSKHFLSTPTITTHLPLASPLVHSFSSALAECVSCAILTPAEVIKQNAQVIQTTSTSPSATIQTLRRFRSNPLALWRGYGALTTRNLPFTALQFPMFEHAKTYLNKANVRRKRRKGILKEGEGEGKFGLLERGMITAAAAGSAGAVAAVVTTPVDVVKTRIMLAAASGFAEQSTSSSASAVGNKTLGAKTATALKRGKVADALGAVRDTGREAAAASSLKDRKQQSSMQIARGVVREQGWKGLFRGGGLRAVWTLLGSGLYLGTYEAGRVFLEERRGEESDRE